ncbi:MAG: hypothetical protein J6A29_05415 [Clostridia bacterium]|nr:hypothetical protein [Clostridia bacterium]
MSEQIAYDEEKVDNNALMQLNTTTDYLKEAVSNLEGINAGDLEINLEIDMIQSNINENINTVMQIKFKIMTILSDYIRAENKSKQLIDEIYDGITSLFGKLIDIGRSFLPTDLNSNTTEIKNKFNLWKEGIKYTVTKGVVEGNDGKIYTGRYGYFIIEPENPDSNIPTVFCFDGDAESKFAGSGANYIEGLITDSEGNDAMQKTLPFGCLAKEGLAKPNIRFIYIPNQTFSSRMNALEPNRFYMLVDGIISDYNNDPNRETKIDVDNLNIMGHSARWKGRSTICKRIIFG